MTISQIFKQLFIFILLLLFHHNIYIFFKDFIYYIYYIHYNKYNIL